MTDNLEFPYINGVRHSFASIEFKFQVAGQKVQVFLKSINYTRTRGRGLVRGNHPDPIAKTRGENEYSADIELYRAEWHLLKETLGEGYGDVSFLALVTYGENGFETVTDEIIGCTLDSTEASNTQGSDPTVLKFNLAPLKIKFGGTDDLAVPLTAPPA